MKRMLTVLAVVISAVAVQVVQAATWTGGGDNKSWNDPNNWGGAVPAANEDVTISPASAVDIAMPNNTSVGKLTAKGASVKLTGGGWFTVTGIDATAYLDINANLKMSTSVGSYSLTFGGADIRGQFDCAPYKSINIVNTGTLNFHDKFTMGASTWMKIGNGGNGTTTGSTTHFYGSLNVAYSIAVGGNTYKSGWLYIHSTGNTIGSLSQSYSRINTMAVGALPENLVIQWIDGEFTEESDNHRCWDFNGFDQTVNRVSAPTIRDSKDHSRRLISTGRAMTLTLKGTADASARADICDDISLVWDPTGDFTQEFVAYPSETTGSITVKGGTFKVSGGATFANASAITINAGATFDLNSTADEALRNVPEVNLNGTLRIAATATNPFGGGKTTLKIGTGAVEVPSGVNVKVNVAEIGGTRIAAKTYKARGSAATGEECDWVTGDGTVQVMTMGETHETRIWSGAAGNGLWNDPGNWNGGIVPQSFDTASFTANATIVDDVAIDNDRAIAIAQDCTVQFNGAVSGGAVISCIGNKGILELRGNNTFTGDLIISNSIVKAYGENALSSSNLGAIRVIKDGHTAGANLQLSGVRIRKPLYNANKNDTANQWGDSILCVAETTNNFEGGFTCTDGHLRMSVDTAAKLTISGGLSFSASYFITRKAGAEVVISGTSAGFPVYNNSGSAADAFMTFACGANVIGTSGGLSATRGISDAMRTTVDNAFRGDSHCYFGGENAKLDLCGHNQQFGRIMAMSDKPAGVICSQEPATLTLIGDETYSNNAVFQGQVSLTKNGTGTVTLQSASTSSGNLSVGGGTLKIAAGASWAGAHINIANGTVFDVADKNAFGKETTISITGTGYINIPVGVTLKCKELTVDGKTETGIFSNNSFVKGGGILRAGRIGMILVVE